MVLDKEAFYEHPFTGSIAVGAEWLQDQIEHGFPDEDLESLIEVVYVYDEEEEKHVWKEV